MKKKIIIGVSAIIILVAVIVSMLMRPSGAVYITTVKVKPGSLASDVDYSGQISAGLSMPVISDTGGRVLSVNVKPGQAVKKDDILFTVDNADILLQYNQAEANYKSAEANFEKVSGGAVKQSEMQLKQALLRAENELRDAESAYELTKEQYNNNTSVAAAQSAYNMAKTDYERIKLLVSLNEESKYSLDNAKSKMDSAAAQLEIAKASAKTALNSADTRLKNASLALKNAQDDLRLTTGTINPENVKSAESQMNSAKAAVDIIKRKLDNTSVKAPGPGYVAVSNVKTGDIIPPQTPVMEIVGGNNMEMALHVTEKGAADVHIGMKAEVTLLGTGRTTEGKVYEIADATDEKTGLVDVKIAIGETGSGLKSGMLASAKLIPDNVNRKLYIPVKSVLSINSDPYVYIVENNKLKKVPVKLGEKRYAYIEVTDGLTPEAQVVLEGNTAINESSAFHVVKTIV
ncbi:MAG: efflux RND transporter periplasmic adaptor subunit [Bacillota bacterium]|nr:efflux RND transporter periplasmic adaptor subunit [Bacillota bacterium]